MMDQLSSGLMSFGVVEQIRQHRDVMASMLTLEGATNFKLYRFITGSKTVTPLGAEKHIILKFIHECPAQCKCRPTAATCDPSITFPMHYNDTKDFEQALDTALEEYFGFGLV